MNDKVEIRWEDGRIEVIVRCSKRVFLAAFAIIITVLLSVPDLPTMAQGIVMLLK